MPQPFQFNPFPDRLYTAKDLLLGFDPAKPQSFGEMRDTKIYLEYVNGGAAAPSDSLTAMMRALHDNAITQNLGRALNNKKVVAVMGGHALSRSDAVYGDVARLCAKLAAKGFLIASGGGPSVMEAVHLGAGFANKSGLSEALKFIAQGPVAPPDGKLVVDGTIDPVVAAAFGKYLSPAVEIIRKYDVHGGIGIPTWMYGWEPFTPFAAKIAKYFQNSIREDGLLALATHGIIYTQGGPGTVQEIFQDAAQNYYQTFPAGANKSGYFSPMIFFGKFWTDKKRFGSHVKPLLNAMFSGNANYKKLVTFTDDPDKVIDHLTRFKPPPNLTIANLNK